MKFQLFIILFINLWCCQIMATPQIMTSESDLKTSVFIDSMPAKNCGEFNNVNAKYNTPEFNYNENSKNNKAINSSIEPSFIGSIISFLFTYLLPLILCILIILGLHHFIQYLRNNNSKQLARNKNEELISTDNYIEDIHDIDFNAQIEQALKNKSYTQAIRWSYLLNLKIMDDKNIIQWEPKKTNQDYYYEVESKQIRKDFKYLTYIYNNIWFGKYRLDDTEAKQILLKFKQYKSLINTI